MIVCVFSLNRASGMVQYLTFWVNSGPSLSLATGFSGHDSFGCFS